MTRPENLRLSEGEPPPAITEAKPGLLHLPGIEAPKNPFQRSFNRLVGQLEAARRNLFLWKTHLTRIRVRVTGELVPLQDRLLEVEAELARELDRQLHLDLPGTPPLRPIEREAMVSLLLHLCRQLLGLADDPAIEALHDRNSEQSFSALREEDAADRRRIEAALRRGFRDAADDPEFDDPEPDGPTVGAGEPSADRGPGPGSGGRRGPARAASRLARKDKKKDKKDQEASEAVREIYRRLVLRLHPDREPDAELRARKTEMMQAVTVAYKERDLLTLLTLQMDVEALGGGDLGELPEERMRRFNRVLREQLELVRWESRWIRKELHGWTGEPPGTRAQHPGPLDHHFGRRLEELREIIGFFEDTIADLRAPRRRRACIDELVVEYQETHLAAEVDDLEGLEALAELLDAMVDDAWPSADASRPGPSQEPASGRKGSRGPSRKKATKREKRAKRAKRG